jgi:hypothetical protein
LVVESLRDHIGEQRWPTFRQRTDVPVTLTVQQGDGVSALLFQAEVVAGEVRISARPEDIEADLPKARVAWMVDTGADVG